MRTRIIFLSALLVLLMMNHIVFGQQDTTLVVNSEGDVGIGTTTPGTKLDVYQDIGEDILYLRTGNGVIRFRVGLAYNSIAGRNWSNKFWRSLYLHADAEPSGIFISADGNNGVNTTEPTAAFDVNGSTGYGQLRLRTSYTPTGSDDSNGNIGDVSWDEDYVYVKTSSGWKRAVLSTW